MQYIHSHIKIEKQNWLEEEKTEVNKLKCLQRVTVGFYSSDFFQIAYNQYHFS